MGQGGVEAAPSHCPTGEGPYNSRTVLGGGRHSQGDIVTGADTNPVLRVAGGEGNVFTSIAIEKCPAFLSLFTSPTPDSEKL